MRSIKMLGLAVVAALALTAIAAVPSASATALCSENTTECSFTSVYTGGTKIEAKLKSGSSFTIATEETALGNPTCSGSTMTAKIVTHEGTPVPIEVTGMTLSGCGSKCTAAEARNLPYVGGLEQTSGGNGTASIGNGGKGEPSFKFTSCPLGVTCPYNASSIPLTFEGGSPARLVIKEAPVTRESGSSAFCPATGKLSATYEITGPKPVYAVSRQTQSEVNVKKTVFCRQAKEVCPAGENDKTGTIIKATVDSPLSLKKGSGLYDLSCGGGSLEGQLTGEFGNPTLPFKVTNMGYSGCSFCKTVVGTASIANPYSATVQGTGGGNGTVTMPIGIYASGCKFPGSETVECTWESTVQLKLIGDGNQPKLLIKDQELAYKSGWGESNCGKTMKVNGSYSVTVPTPIWVSEGT